MNIMMEKIRSERGAAALIAVLVIGLAALSMAASATMIGVDQAGMSYAYDKGLEAQALADGCAEEALRRIKIFPVSRPFEYDLNLDDGSCHVALPDDKTISLVSRSGDYFKRAELDITASGTDITVNNWQ